MVSETRTSTMTAENAARSDLAKVATRDDLTMSVARKFLPPREFGFTADELGEGGTDDAAGFLRI
jgi:hypothetical protein